MCALVSSTCMVWIALNNPMAGDVYQNEVKHFDNDLVTFGMHVKQFGNDFTSFGMTHIGMKRLLPNVRSLSNDNILVQCSNKLLSNEFLLLNILILSPVAVYISSVY